MSALLECPVVETVSTEADGIKAVVEDAKKYFDPSVNIVITGNPVRGEMLTAEKEKSKEKLDELYRIGIKDAKRNYKELKEFLGI